MKIHCIKLEQQHPPTSILDVKALLTFAMMLTTFPTLKYTDIHTLYCQHGAVITVTTQSRQLYLKTQCSVTVSSVKMNLIISNHFICLYLDNTPVKQLLLFAE